MAENEPDIPLVESERAIKFICGHCKHTNFHEYTLEKEMVGAGFGYMYAHTVTKFIYSDVIACSKCEKDNKVFEKP